jgi:hypothetical protein
VRQAAFDYAGGIYEAAVDRVERAADGALAKRGLVSRPGTGLFLTAMNAEMLIEATRAGGGRATAADRRAMAFARAVNPAIDLDLKGTILKGKPSCILRYYVKA